MASGKSIVQADPVSLAGDVNCLLVPVWLVRTILAKWSEVLAIDQFQINTFPQLFEFSSRGFCQRAWERFESFFFFDF